MTFEIALLAGAGGATLARLVAKEDGPFKIFPRFSAWAAQCAREIETRYPPYSEAVNSALDLLGCPICQSVWWGGLLALLYSLLPDGSPLWTLAYVLAAPSIAWAIGESGKWNG